MIMNNFCEKNYYVLGNMIKVTIYLWLVLTLKSPHYQHVCLRKWAWKGSMLCLQLVHGKAQCPVYSLSRQSVMETD